jgi:hypothetical protein
LFDSILRSKTINKAQIQLNSFKHFISPKLRINGFNNKFSYIFIYINIADGGGSENKFSELGRRSRWQQMSAAGSGNVREVNDI